MHPAATPSTIGPYRVVRALGVGGWSTVYEVIGPDGATLALKRLRAELPDAALARFRREAESLRRIDHPGVLRLIDVGTDGGAPYLVTPRVDGASVRELLARGAIGIEAALLVVAAAAEALGAIHAAGLVHRDIKPENLMIAASGRVVVIDLGLALGPEHSRHTEENALTGSVPYMAPEQIEDRAPTPASDVWALAVVLYEAALGRRPFQRERQSEEVAAILAGKHELLAAADPRCPDEVAALVARCLDHAPDRRPADGAALAREIAAHLDWLAPGAVDDARRTVAADPSGYAARVAPLRAARSAAAARAALAAGDAFGASRHVDRALALAPDDPELRELLDAVMSGGPLAGETMADPDPDPSGTLVGFTPARPSAGHRVVERRVASGDHVAVHARVDSLAPPRRPRRRAIAVAAAVALVVGIGLVARYAGRSDDPPPAPAKRRVLDDTDDDRDVSRPSRVAPSQPAPTPPPPPEIEHDDEEEPAPAMTPATDVVEKPSRVKPSRPDPEFGPPPDAAPATVEKPSAVAPSRPR